MKVYTDSQKKIGPHRFIGAKGRVFAEALTRSVLAGGVALLMQDAAGPTAFKEPFGILLFLEFQLLR